MTKKMWGGRFTGAATASVEEYTQSESFDRALYREDITGSKARLCAGLIRSWPR